MTKGFGYNLAGILTCAGARGWKWWGWWPKVCNDGLGRGRWGGGPGGCNGWGGAGGDGDGGWWLGCHIDVVQEGKEAGTGVDASCGETRAAEEEPVVKNWFLFGQLANWDKGAAHKDRVGRIGWMGKEWSRVC